MLFFLLLPTIECDGHDTSFTFDKFDIHILQHNFADFYVLLISFHRKLIIDKEFQYIC